MVPPWGLPDQHCLRIGGQAGSGAGLTDAKLRLNDRNDINRRVRREREVPAKKWVPAHGWISPTPLRSHIHYLIFIRCRIF